MESSAVINRPFLTPKEVADVLRITRQTVYRQIDLGEIPAVRVGKSYRIPRSEFEEKFGLERGAA